VAAAGGLALATLALSHSPQPSNLAVVFWIAAVLLGFDACRRLESGRIPGPSSPVRGSSPAKRRETRDEKRGTRDEGQATNDLSRRERVVVALLVGLSLVLSLHDLTHWRWSGTPDEAHFFNAAKDIATGRLQPFLFSEQGVFGVHPVLSSQYQALFMWVFGPVGFAWRLSSAAAVAFAVPCLYLFARRLWDSGVAVAATVLFATTPLVVGFAHLGYNNTQVYPVVLGALALVAGGRRFDRLFLAGFIAGLGFYTFYPARLAPLLALLLGVSLGTFTLRGDGSRRAAAFLAGFVLCVAPAALLIPESLARVSVLTSVAGGADLTTIAAHWLKAIAYPVHFEHPHHFQWTPIVDPISGPLSLVGLVLCAVSWRRSGDRFLAAAYVLAALLVGATSHHDRPPLTRLLFLSPFVALLAAVALQRVEAFVARQTRRPWPGRVLASFLVAVAAVWSVIALQYNVRHRYHGSGDGTTTEALRIALQAPSEAKIIYLQREGSTMLMVDSVFDQYGMAERLAYAQGLDAVAVQALAGVRAPFVVILGLEEGNQRVTAEQILARRFGELRWQESDAGRAWSLRYAEVS
jgi:4-amino-4-deoxy-L-arabinose transferase-like glycosyltransferase